MPFAKDEMKTPRFSTVEEKVQEVASRQANHELLRVPWGRFRSAYEQYPRWQALALWSEVVVATAEGRIPPVLLVTLKKHCPGLIEGGEPTQPELLALHLLEWVHVRRFGYVKREGWFDALTFYGVRHPRSECAWLHWEHCETEWNRRQPKEFPLFDDWWHRALQMKLCDNAGYLEVARAVGACIDWKALLFWLRPLFSSNLKLPSHVMSELERSCPGILKWRNVTARPRNQEKSKMWRHVVKYGKDPCLSEAKEAGWLDFLTERVRSHPRYVRIVAYGKRWAKEWYRDHSYPYPSLGQWQQAADRYIAARPK